MGGALCEGPCPSEDPCGVVAPNVLFGSRQGRDVIGSPLLEVSVSGE